jgi:glycosyltransferase involved in cell wall biosynthesis
VKALVVTALPPDRALGGGHIRQVHLFAALAARVETHLLVAGAVTDPMVRGSAASITEVPVTIREASPLRMRRRAEDLWQAVVERDPIEATAHRRVRRRFAPLLGNGDGFDVVCVEFHGLAPLLPPHRSNRWALTLHNLVSAMDIQARAVARTRREAWLLRRDEHKARRFERWALASYDRLMVVSAEDAAVLGGGLVVPNGVDIGAFALTPLPSEPRLVVTGALYNRPNAEGIVWFCEQVLPDIQERVPGATLDIVGRRPGPEVAELARLPGVAVHSDVASVAPHLARARVAIVPLRIGTGSRLKALEAMAAGRPVLGTSIGLGGLEVEDGVNVVVADDPSAMAEGAVELLTQSARAERLAAAGRRLVERRYSWASIGRGYVDALIGDLT